MPKIIKNGKAYGSSPSALSGLQDTNLSNVSSGNVLAFDGTKWVNSNGNNFMRCAYSSQSSLTEYEINYDVLSAISGRQFGMALVFAWKDIFALFYNSDNTIFISPLTPNPSRTASVSWISSTRNIKITFDQQIWLGISVYPV